MLIESVKLSELTTIELGGTAKNLLRCSSAVDIYKGIDFAGKNNLSMQILAGGSNIIFADEGYDGLILKIEIKGIGITQAGDLVIIKAAAGENWDEFVKKVTELGLKGIECLSGIPGTVGATPIQNVGAYGQEVCEVIRKVTAVDRVDQKIVVFENSDCNFSYRDSIFKSAEKGKYIITEVEFGFRKNKSPEIGYDHLKVFIERNRMFDGNVDDKAKIKIIRDAVIALRKSKSMVVSEDDPDSKSCGSFFTNPVLDRKEFEKFKVKVKNEFPDFPCFISGSKYKIPAAWLVENAGFQKGYTKGGAGISRNHSLALVNKGGTTKEILFLAGDIEKSVFGKFGIQLKTEPVIVN